MTFIWLTQVIHMMNERTIEKKVMVNGETICRIESDDDFSTVFTMDGKDFDVRETPEIIWAGLRHAYQSDQLPKP
jgi:hypothetical protein